jgi:hypothetical protein
VSNEPTTVLVLAPGSCARKSTRITVPPVALAEAVSVTGALSPTVAAAVGLVSETVGGTAVTVILTGVEVAELPFES